MAPVQAVIPRYDIGQGDGDQEIGRCFHAEQLKAEQQGSDRAVGDAAKDAAHADSGCKRGIEMDAGSEKAAEGSADRQARNDLAALVACGNGDGSEAYFQEESPAVVFSCHAGCNGVDARSVVALVTGEQCCRKQDAAADGGTDIGIGEQQPGSFFKAVEADAEQHTDQAKANCKKTGIESALQVKVRYDCNVKGHRCCPEMKGNIRSDIGSKHTGQQCGIVHDAYRHDFHGKDRRCHRGAEQSGKSSAHSAHDHGFFVGFTEPEPFAEVASEGSADLKSSSFPADGCACEMGQYGRKEDQHRHPSGEMVVGLNRGQHEIGAAVLIIMKKVIKQQNDHCSDGQQCQEIRIIFPKGGHKGDTVVK